METWFTLFMTNTTQNRWAKDYNNVAATLAPHMLTIGNETFIDPTNAPAVQVALYRTLTSVGYANGFFG